LRPPLDRFGSIKLKLGIVIVAAVIVTLLVNEAGLAMNVKPFARGAAAVAIGLVMVQLLARGMTRPLRDMAAAAKAMAAGEHGRQVSATSQDEVGDLARAFNAMAAELAEVDRMRRDLVANVSHELRTPISALQAQLENLVDGVATARPEVLATMLRQVERLGRLVEQLLDLSRLESGASPLQRRRFEVAPMLREVVAEAHAVTNGSTVTVSVADPGLTAHADPERVHQVVANLVHNAVRHSPLGGRVEVTACRRGDGVEIAVCDEGPGIPAADVQRVFERFYRADAARAASDGGAGLGLAIARWIVDLHGGEIHPEPRSPRGCRMVVQLPGGFA
jgi:signal transduction histidine kinase